MTGFQCPRCGNTNDCKMCVVGEVPDVTGDTLIHCSACETTALVDRFVPDDDSGRVPGREAML